MDLTPTVPKVKCSSSQSPVDPSPVSPRKVSWRPQFPIPIEINFMHENPNPFDRGCRMPAITFPHGAKLQGARVGCGEWKTPEQYARGLLLSRFGA